MPKDEWRAIKQAVDALEDAFAAVFREAHIGMTAAQIDTVVDITLAKHGALRPRDRFLNTPCVIDASGAGPKLRKDRVPLEAGKLWMMDNSIVLNGFWADLGRYGWFGRPPRSLLDAYQRIIDRQDEIAACMRPGVPMDELLRSVPPGLGFEIHRIATEPSMRPFCGNLMPSVIRETEESVRAGLVFEPGQVICVELWAGLSGGIEDMYRVDGKGVTRISTLPRVINIHE